MRWTRTFALGRGGTGDGRENEENRQRTLGDGRSTQLRRRGPEGEAFPTPGARSSSERQLQTPAGPRVGPVPQGGLLSLPGALPLPSPPSSRRHPVCSLRREDCLSSESESKSQRVYGGFNLSHPPLSNLKGTKIDLRLIYSLCIVFSIVIPFHFQILPVPTCTLRYPQNCVFF